MGSGLRRMVAGAACAAAMLAGMAGAADAAPKKHFKLAWTIYVGWMPWPYAAEHGIVRKWADKYGLSIDVVQINDYAESINQYTAGAFDALTITNMDTLATPAVGGVDSTSIITGDYSNGNDAVILKDKDSLGAIKGQKVNLVQFSVSHYLLDRALQTIGLSERDVHVVNTSDSDMEAAWKTPSVSAVVTWNPIVQDILADKHAHEVFDSSKIPGEIMDLCIVNSATLHDNPDFAKALVGIWYDVLHVMQTSPAARAEMGKQSGTDEAGFESQLKTTHLFATPAEAVAFTAGRQLPVTMKMMRDFLFTHGLMGQGAASADVVGIAFPDGSILGDKNNVKFRFDDSFMEEAKDGRL